MDKRNSHTIPLKTQAKALRKYLAEQDIELGHSKCLEAVARAHGFKDWNTAVASGGIDYDAAFFVLDDLDLEVASPAATERIVEWLPIHEERWYQADPETAVETPEERAREAKDFRADLLEHFATITLEKAVEFYEEGNDTHWVNSAWVQQILDDLVETGYFTRDGDKYVEVPFDGYLGWFPHEYDQVGDLESMLEAGVPLGDALRRIAGCHIATARRYYRLAQVADSDRRVWVFDPPNEPLEPALLQIRGPKTLLQPLVGDHLLEEDRHA